MIINIAKDFSETPGGRTDADGPHNGRRFRTRFLEKAVRNKQTITINLDGIAGLPGSFCDEAFGRLVVDNNLSRATFDSLLKFTGSGDEYIVNRGMINLYVDRALTADASL